MESHGEPDDTGFEPCLVHMGCQHVIPDEMLLPFHGPRLAMMSFDLLAWQQPAPFCCAKPFNRDAQAREATKEFGRMVKLGDAKSLGVDKMKDPNQKEGLKGE